jgi:hypothetical protein
MKATFIKTGLMRLLLVGLLITGACQTQRQELSFKSIATSGHDVGLATTYHDKEPTIVVIANATDIALHQTGILAPASGLSGPLQQLDYSQVFAVLVIQGYGLSSSHSVNIRSIWRQGDKVSINAEFIEPGPESRSIDALTAPYQLVTVSKGGTWDEEIKFVLVVSGETVAELSPHIP